MNKNILICLNKLDIGGIETVVVNQGLELLERGYKVVILSQSGIYTKMMEEKGAICIDFTYEKEKGYNIEDSNFVEEIIKKYEIGQVHIHQFDCIPTMFISSINTNTPYVAYIHTGIKGAYDWFENSFLGYREIFNMYFNMAQKIVTITEQAKMENKQRYNVEDEKYIIINNSIRFDENMLENNKIPEKINKFLMISRFSNEKMKSIENAVGFFKNYHKKHQDAFLTIVGDGVLKKEVEELIQDIGSSVKLLGARNDVIDIIKENDIVIGLDRSILEAISVKKLAIISGYENITGIVTNDNIEKVAFYNFSGEGLKEKNTDELIEELEELTSEKIEKIVNRNYEYVYKNLNMKNNIYLIDDTYKTEEININKKIYYKCINSLIEDQKNANYNAKKVFDDCKENQKYFETQIENLQNENKILKQKLEDYEKTKEELETIQNSKVWKFVNKILRK